MKAAGSRSFEVIPNPIPSSLELIPPMREFFRRYYDSCLDTAVEGQWQGFSCDGCRACEPVRWDLEDRKADGVKCKALLWAIYYLKPRMPIHPAVITGWLEDDAKWHQEFGGVLCVRWK